MTEIFEKCEGFDWDDANSDENWKKHKVTKIECEQSFFNRPLIVDEDHKHSTKEKRWYMLGRTDIDRKLFIVFTIRKNLIRVISAKNMNKKERKIYYEKVK